MKKFFLLICTTIILSTLSVQAQNLIWVSGYVTDELTGEPVPDHDVYIMLNDSTIFYSTIPTNQYGYYMDSIVPGGGTINSIYISTNDLCVYGVHDTLIQNPDTIVTADFEICVDTIHNTSCQADFYYVPDSSNYYSIQFVDYSTSSLPISTWFWDFGDGTSSGLQNPTHAYNSSGYYTVCLTIYSDSGQCTSTDCMSVYVSGGGMDCNADFSYGLDSMQTVYFYDQSTTANPITYYEWSFGDGSISNLQNPIHQYAVPGTYNVCLYIESVDSGMYCSDTICMDVVVAGSGSNCMADFDFWIDSIPDAIVYFYDLSTPSGLVDSWYWDFGDGNTSTQQNPTHTYNSTGSFNVCLTITADSATCTSTYCQEIIVPVGGINCEANFAGDTAYAGSPVQFTDLSISGIGTIVSWDWLFGDGSVSYVQNPTHVYTNPGTYNVCLTIQSQGMGMYCIDTACYSVVVLPAVQQYQLGGNVFAGIYQLDLGFAYAYESSAGNITNVFSGMIDTLGYYQFYPLLAADYYVKVEPSPNSTYFGQYVPTYYGDVTTWDDALLINLTQNIYTADINLVPVSMGMYGPGTMSGTIEHGSTNKSYTPASDIQIMLTNQEGEYVGLVYSDDEGEFEFSGLDYGIYSLHAEVMGVHMEQNEYTITEEIPVIQDISMIMTDDEIFFGPNDIEILGDLTLSEVYPNPVKGVLKLDIGSSAPTTLSVKIVNQLGQAMHFETLQLEQAQILEISTDQLQPGMYFLEVISKDGYRTARRFVKQ